MANSIGEQNVQRGCRTCVRILVLLALAGVHVQAHAAPCKCLPVNTGHFVGTGTGTDAQGRAITSYMYDCDTGAGDHVYDIECVKQPAGRIRCACERDSKLLRTITSSSFPDTSHAIAACGFPQ